jgi:hypothetical protein
VRAVHAILSTIALFSGFLQAPFLHVHAEEADHAAASPAHVHFHIAHDGSGPVFEAHAAGEDAIDLDWGICSPSAPVFAVDPAVSKRIVVPAPGFVSLAILIPRTRGHDPPDIIPKQPRSPPA